MRKLAMFIVAAFAAFALFSAHAERVPGLWVYNTRCSIPNGTVFWLDDKGDFSCEYGTIFAPSAGTILCFAYNFKVTEGKFYPGGVISFDGLFDVSYDTIPKE